MSRGLSMAMAGILVGLGVALFAKAVRLEGFHHLTVEHILGPGLVLVGILRFRMQKMIDGGYARGKSGNSALTPEDVLKGGEDGDTT